MSARGSVSAIGKSTRSGATPGFSRNDAAELLMEVTGQEISAGEALSTKTIIELDNEDFASAPAQSESPKSAIHEIVRENKPAMTSPETTEPLQDITAPGDYRVTYEESLERYGRWKYIRYNVYAHLILTQTAFLVWFYLDILDVSGSQFEKFTFKQQPYCNCSRKDMYLGRLEESLEIFKQMDYMTIKKLTSVAMVGIVCPLWEKWIGRRHSLLIALCLGCVSCVCMSYSVQDSWITIYFMIYTFCCFIVITVSISNLFEMLPYNLRLVAALPTALQITVTPSSLVLLNHNFHLDEAVRINAVYFFLGIFVTFFFVDEALCHLVAQGRVEDAEQAVFQKEFKCMKDENSVDDEEYHSGLAKKIFEDLVFTDFDDHSLWEFMVGLATSRILFGVVIIILLCISSSLSEYESRVLHNQIFGNPLIIVLFKLVGYSLSFPLLYVLRNMHRPSAFVLLQCAIMLIIVTRRVIIPPARDHVCSHATYIDEYVVFTVIMNAITLGLNATLQMLVILYFLEITPSLFRVSTFTTIFLTYAGTLYLFRRLGLSFDTWIGMISADMFRLFVTVLTMLMIGRHIPYCVYLYDLVPKTEIEKEEEDESAEDLEYAEDAPLLGIDQNANVVF